MRAQTMKITQTHLEGLLVIEPTLFTDSRGYFYESFNEQKFKDAQIPHHFVQDNQSMSMRGAVRGLHFQHPPHAQAKLVRVTQGAVYDVAVDIRKHSPTYGQHFGIELNHTNHLMLFIPVGFAHGFATLQDHSVFQYKCSALYNPNSDDGIFWNDPNIGISWPVSNPLISNKDQNLQPWKQFESPF